MRFSKPTFLLLIALVATLGPALRAMDTEEAIKERIFDTYSLDPERTTVEITSNRLSTRFVDPADLSLRAFSQRDPAGPFTVYATIEHDGRTIDKGEVRLRVSHFKEVLVALDKINRHDTLTEAAFELKTADVTSLREQAIIDPEQIKNCRSKRNIHKDQILTTSYVEPIPDIEVGDEVTISYEDGICSVSAPGTVLQTGWVGESVRVKNKASGKIVQARVVDDRTVKIDP